jgi:hypothetical protein
MGDYLRLNSANLSSGEQVQSSPRTNGGDISSRFRKGTTLVDRSKEATSERQRQEEWIERVKDLKSRQHSHIEE